MLVSEVIQPPENVLVKGTLPLSITVHQGRMARTYSDQLQVICTFSFSLYKGYQALYHGSKFKIGSCDMLKNVFYFFCSRNLFQDYNSLEPWCFRQVHVWILVPVLGFLRGPR